MTTAPHIKIGPSDPYPLDVFTRACQLLWLESNQRFSIRDIIFILKKEFGRSAYTICEILSKGEGRDSD